MKKNLIVLLTTVLSGIVTCSGILASNWKTGIVSQEFVFKQAAFPESHASTIAETPEGLIVAWFGGMKERYKDVCIYVSRRVDDQWTVPTKVADGIQNDSLRLPCWNPVLFQIPGGDLLLFYKIGPSVSGWTGWMKRSADHGKTWGPAIALPEGYLGPIKNKPVLLNNEIVCPSSTEKGGWKVHFEKTDLNCSNWSMVGPINDGKAWSTIQPSILTYPDGKWQVLCRSLNRTVASAWSLDQGKTWSEFESVGLPNNNSGTDAVTLKDGRQLLVYNHVLPPDKLAKGPRTPLNVAVSKDGKNWFASLVLEDSPISQYSYPSVIQSADGMVHIVYTWRRERIRYVKVDPSKLVMVPIKKGLWPGTKTAVVKNEDPTRYRISVCDWMILKRQKLGAIQLARVIGCDGLELDMGPLGQRPTFENALKDSAVLYQFKKEANDVGIKFSSVAMSGFYAQSLAKRADYVTPIKDCIELMKKLNVTVGFLPLGVEGDLNKNPELRPELVKRLRVIGQMAEKAGVVIGIETALDAAGDKALLKEIGSKGIQIYFNFQNPLVAGRDLIKEMKILGIQNICQIHCTNTDKFWLEKDPQIDLPLIKKALDKMGYTGWLVMERSRDANDGRNVKGNYGANARYLKSIFQPE